MRRKLVAGNWKMFTSASSARELAAGIVRDATPDLPADLAICPPFPYLAVVADVLRGSRIALGGQNLYPEREGAFTGEVSPRMLIDVGCRFAIVGHSERRQMLGENDRFINRKVHAGLEAGLSMIVCIGETLAQREADQTEDVLKSQLLGSLESVRAADADRMVIAYEPVWAIGTGRNATPEQAQLAHAFIRRQVAAQLGSDAANAMVIQYGGSVKPDNAAAILSQPDVDGALVGGASLKAESFLAIARAAG